MTYKVFFRPSLFHWRAIFCAVLVVALPVFAEPTTRLDKPRQDKSIVSQHFERVVPGRVFQFPEDHGLHPNVQTEWWYVTANLTDKHGASYGIQFTLFSTLDRLDVEDRRIYFAHAALSSSEEFFFSERYARSDLGHAGVRSKPWKAFIDHWQFTGTNAAPLPGRLQVSEPSFAYDLSLSDADYYLQDQDGYSPKDASGTMASYYYNAPFIDIQGTLRIGNESVHVEGDAWLDREWSNHTFTPSRLGWDWLALHLDANNTLMLYRVRSEGQEHFSASLMKRDGTIRQLPSADISWTPLRSKLFQQKEYAVEWKLEIPSESIDLHVRAINDNQFLNTLIPYWEGAVTITGSHDGVGYMELFGQRQLELKK